MKFAKIQKFLQTIKTIHLKLKVLNSIEVSQKMAKENSLLGKEKIPDSLNRSLAK